MKTGLGLYSQFRIIYSYLNLFRFLIRKKLIGFDVANQFIQGVDKFSLLLILRKNGAIIGQNCDVETGLIFHNCKNYSNLIIGNNCHIGKNCFFDLRGRVVIGNNVVISMQCTFLTHIDMNKSSLSEIYPASSAAIHIKENCFFGARTIVLKGLTIGQNVITGAGSVITKNVEPNRVIGGIPAETLKKLK
jgi:acetyltransferase-like isoleucine patch superfamily enzyme